MFFSASSISLSPAEFESLRAGEDTNEECLERAENQEGAKPEETSSIPCALNKESTTNVKPGFSMEGVSKETEKGSTNTFSDVPSIGASPSFNEEDFKTKKLPESTLFVFTSSQHRTWFV